ncbi:MAG: cell division protein SepF [Candidatus Altiarchaeota archaeon]|nr:cell division protein SepF [Candidatus Altiarchaeota archaeon]
MVFRKLLGGGKSGQGTVDEVDIEDYLNDLSVRDGKIIESDDITYVKPLDLDSTGKGIGNVLAELEKRNVVVLNVKSLSSNKVLLKSVVKDLREACMEMDGDIGRISEEKILIVPQGMRIVSKIN